MKVVTYRNGFDYHSENGIALCLGFFDGLHLGHQALIRKALKENKEVGVLTFTGSMKSLTNQRSQDLVLTSLKERGQLLDKMGVKCLFVLPFTQDVCSMSPLDFISNVLKPIGISRIYIGSDFRFGYKAEGDASLLGKYFKVEIVDFVMSDENRKISSRDIISLIQRGEIKEADALLGREYSIEGTVAHGFHNGTSLGFPTANIVPDDTFVIPSNGVYATKLLFKGKYYLSMTDIGTHPTIDKLDKPDIETNIFDFDEDIYNDPAVLFFIDRIRDEKKYDSIADLVNQLHHDRDYIKKNYKLNTK